MPSRCGVLSLYHLDRSLTATVVYNDTSLSYFPRCVYFLSSEVGRTDFASGLGAPACAAFIACSAQRAAVRGWGSSAAAHQR